MITAWGEVILFGAPYTPAKLISPTLGGRQTTAGPLESTRNATCWPSTTSTVSGAMVNDRTGGSGAVTLVGARPNSFPFGSFATTQNDFGIETSAGAVYWPVCASIWPGALAGSSAHAPCPLNFCFLPWGR